MKAVDKLSVQVQNSNMIDTVYEVYFDEYKARILDSMGGLKRFWIKASEKQLHGLLAADESSPMLTQLAFVTVTTGALFTAFAAPLVFLACAGYAYQFHRGACQLGAVHDEVRAGLEADYKNGLLKERLAEEVIVPQLDALEKKVTIGAASIEEADRVGYLQACFAKATGADAQQALPEPKKEPEKKVLPLLRL